MNYTKKCLASVLFFLVSVFYVKGQQTPPFETVTSFFEAFHKKDSLALYDFFDDEAKINFTSNTKEGMPVVKRLSIPDFVRRVSNRADSPVWEERIGTPEIHVFKNLASMWIPFEFHLDGQFSHSGFNLFQLFWNGIQWKIMYLADSK
jgi:hypothetical protein